MSHNVNVGSPSSIAGRSPDKSYRPSSSVYEIVSPLTTKFQSELDAVHTNIKTMPQPRDIPEDRIASPYSERLAGEYRADLLLPRPESVEPDQNSRRNKGGMSLSPIESKRIYGLVPAVFWIVVVLIVFLVAAGVAIGLGVGLTRVQSSGDDGCPYGTSATIFVNNSGNPTPQPKPALADIPSSTFTTTNPIGSTVSTTASAAWHSYTNPGTVDSVIVNAPVPDIFCLDHNNATTTFPFSVNGSSLTYEIHCETNYDTGDFPSVKDIQVIPNVQSLAMCIELCSYYTVQLPQGGPRDCSTGYSAFCTGIYFWQSACYLKSGVVPGITGGSASGDGAMLVKNASWSE